MTDAFNERCSPLRDDTDAKLPAAAYLRYQSRADGWSAGRQAAFLAYLADNGVVEDAARAVGMSVSGGYALRRTARGYVFNLGWEAALIIARRVIADRLMTAAIKGEESRWVREEGITTYTRQNTKLSLTLLDRINPATTLAEVMATATRFDHFLELIDGRVTAQEMWDYFFDDALPHSEIEARERVRAALLLTEESAILEGDHADDDPPIEFKSMDGPPGPCSDSFLTQRVMTAFHQCLHDADGDHQDAEIIEIPDCDADETRLRQRPQTREDQQVGYNKQHCAYAKAVAREIAVPCHRGHCRQNDAIARKLNAGFGIWGQEKRDEWRQDEKGYGEQLLTESCADPAVPCVYPDRDDMPGGEGQRAVDHIQFDQSVAERIKCQYRRQHDKLALMMAAQRIGHQQTHRSHFPDDRKQIALDGQQQPRRRKAYPCKQAGEQPRSFMREILPHVVALPLLPVQRKEFLIAARP